MSEHIKFGNKGEDAAAQYLVDKGYLIKDRNWRTGKLEIDIIAEYNNMIIFIEVKSRTGTYFEQPFQAVNKKKQKYLIIAANAYIEKFNIDLEARFDIISVVEKSNTFDIEHIDDAFYPLV